MERKIAEYGNWYLEKPAVGGGFDLFKDTVIETRIDGIKNGETRKVSKREGYNMTLGMIIDKIATDDTLDEIQAGELLNLKELVQNIASMYLNVIEELQDELKSWQDE